MFSGSKSPLQVLFKANQGSNSFDIGSPGLRLAAEYAQELRLVQRPAFMWIAPFLLYPILHQFAMFTNVTSLSLNCFSIHYFNEDEITEVFEHFFPTVRTLNLEDPRSSVNGLIRFLLHFRVLDDFSVSDPEWDGEDVLPVIPTSAKLPPFRGELYLLRLHADSADFIGLLAHIPIAFRRVLVVSCQLPPAPINRLLNQLSPSLRQFSMSTWFDSESKVYPSLAPPADDPNAGDCFLSVDLSPCTGVEEIRFFVGMVPAGTFPIQRMGETLGSVSSRRVQTIVLHFIMDGGLDVSDNGLSRGFVGLDAQLQRIASEYEGVGNTMVKLPVNDSFTLGSYLSNFRTSGILVCGSRIGDSLACGDVQ